MEAETAHKCKRAYWLVECAKHSTSNREALNRLEELQIIEKGYAEPGYSGDVIAFANWNKIGHYVKEENKHVYDDDTMPRLLDLMERVGIEVEWDDEWTTCHVCGGALRTSPDCYGWKPSYVFNENDCSIICEECLRKDKDEMVASLEALEGETKKAVTMNIDLEDYGYKCLIDSLDRGMHYGQDADPSVIAASLRKRGVGRFLFKIDSTGQFDTRFSVWVHEDEYDEMDDTIETDGPSVAAAMEKSLRESTVQQYALRKEQQENGGIIYTKVSMQGAETRLVSPEEFVEGVKG